MRKLDIAPLTQWITAVAVDHPLDVPAQIQQRHQGPADAPLPRRTALGLTRRLEAAQWLVREGTQRRPRWRAGPLRQVVQHYALAGLEEDRPWRRDFAPYFELPSAVRRMAQHAFTELVNNAVEHSGGERLTVSMRQTPVQLQLLVSDDGCGLFHRIEQDFAIGEPALAMLELAKGRLTSQPERHCGQGLVVTSMLADVFDVRANAAGFQRRAWSPTAWQGMPAQAALAQRPGTSIYMAIALETQRTLDDVQRSLSVDAAGYAFERTRVPLHLMVAPGSSALASRAEARRVAARLANFRRAEIDFSGIEEIGHPFAHELFTVLARAHPELTLVPVAASPRVAAMIGAAAH